MRGALEEGTQPTGGFYSCRRKEASHQAGVRMQDVDQDPFICPDLGEIPDDLSEYLNDDYLGKFVVPYLDTDVLFNDPSLECEEELSTCSALPMHTEPAGPDVPQQQQQTDKTSNRTGSRRKRARAPRLQRCTDENSPSRPKRHRAAGRPETVVAQVEPPVTRGSHPCSAETAGLFAPPPRILHLHPSIQFIPIPDAAAYQMMRALRVSHPVISLPLPNTAAAPTYILVPAASPPFKQEVPPLSPMDGAVAPVQMSSPPAGSLSDAASRAGSPTRASRPSPSSPGGDTEESAVPPSPAALDVPQVVKDYIVEAKAHVSQTCQDMESGLSLTSQYVDVQVSRKEILHSGKNTNKVLEKDLVIAGDTDRRESLLGHLQMFKGSKGDKPKRFVLLLGNAGMGKTTLVRKLCLDWSRNCLPEFDFVFFLDGKALSLPEASHSLQTLLLNFSSLAPPCTDPEAVYAQILAAPKRVLVIFDGFDEVRDYEILLQTQEKDLITSLHKDSKAPAFTVRQLYSAVLQRLLLPGCTLLLTTRPRGSASQLLRRTDSLLEVCGFNPANVETCLSRYFTDPDLRATALGLLKSSSYLQLLCWNPGLCRLVCLALEHCKGLGHLPRTLTGLCHQVLCLKLEEERRSALSEVGPQSLSGRSVEKPQTQISSSPAVRRRRSTRPTAPVHTRSRTQSEKGEDGVDGEEMRSVGGEVDRTEREWLSQLSSLAWKGVKANSAILSPETALSAQLKAFGQRTGLFFSYPRGTRPGVSSDERGEDGEEMGTRKNGKKRGKKGRTYDEDAGASEEHFLLWANPFLQSYLAAVHLSLSRTVTDRAFVQTLPFHPGQKERRRPQREELDLTQRFAVGLLFHDRAELQRLRSSTEKSVGDVVAAKRALVTGHLQGLSHGDLSPARVLEACHHVFEAGCTHGGERLVAHLAANLPEVLTFHGVPLSPSDVFAVRNVLESGGTEGRRFSLDLEDSGIQIPGLRALVGLNNISTYRACIADVISLWEQLEQSGEDVLLRETVSKFKTHPLKATRACHVEHLAKLVQLHARRRLSLSSSQSDSVLSEGVPAVKELHKLEFELGPGKCAPVLSQLWKLLPGLHNLQHLDMENSKIGDGGAEKLADALVHLGSLEILDLSQNCISDEGVKKLAITLKDLPKLHCLSLNSNEISDEGAESLAAVLPQAPSLTDLDLEYNKLTDVGAQSLAASLRNCKKMKTLRMWNQCIPYGVFERLQQQDNRIHWQ
uniref:Class II, major histocompatibility complex, transactivator n=1 Tax=Gasterosteus aculeatus aculeatus TaxID=481459 RepID=A0AAQ4QPQ5_GASAC|nr:MHC class II transactivator isoform X2 [Gasterosteus aculeatus aculeatus]